MLKADVEWVEKIMEEGGELNCPMLKVEVEGVEKTVGGEDENCLTVRVQDARVEKIIGEGKEENCSMQPTTLVLIGRIGNGKSSTGNSILGCNAFATKFGSSSVTNECMLQKTTLKDGRVINVVDTPGLFDTNLSRKTAVLNEIIKCIDHAKDGVHGVLLVLSLRSRFTPEEATVLNDLQRVFGPSIVNYMVVTFTGGDEFEHRNTTLDDYLNDSPPHLKDLLLRCNMRMLIFNNITTSEAEKQKQINELLKKVDDIISDNGGIPYSNDMFHKAQESSRKYKKDKEKAYGEQVRQFQDMMDQNQITLCSQIEEATRLAQQESAQEIQKLQEQFSLSSRKQVEEAVRAAQRESAQEIQRLQEQFSLSAQKQTEEAVRAAQRESDQKIQRLQEGLEQAKDTRPWWECTIM